MSIKSILLPVDDVEITEAVLTLALAVAKRFNAHLEVLHVRPDPRRVIPYTTLAASHHLIKSMLEAAERDIAQRADGLRAVVDGFCKANEIAVVDKPGPRNAPSIAWYEETGRESDVVRRRGRLVDLIFLMRPVSEAPAPMVVETALLETGRPVLLAPPRPPKTLGERIAVGWDGSAEAARAVAAAGPLLVQAKEVTVFTFEESADMRLTARELAAQLGWHGILAGAEVARAGRRSVGEALLAEAGRRKADLLVVGGYGHSRMRELVLGGATRHILLAAEIPVLMAH